MKTEGSGGAVARVSQSEGSGSNPDWFVGGECACSGACAGLLWTPPPQSKHTS